MKKIITLFLAFFVAGTINAQVSIGSGNDGDASNSPPLNAFWGFNYTQSIYLSSEINASGVINSLDFALNPGSDFSATDENVDVWIGHTTKNNFNSTTDWVNVSTLTQVLSDGTVSIANDVLTITFDNAFNYNGSDNLIIAVDGNELDFDGNADFVLSTNGPNQNMTLRNRSDTTNPDPLSPPTGLLTQNRGNITINGITQSCPVPSNIVAVVNSATEATISWTAGGSESSWNYEWGITGFAQGSGTTGSTSTPTLDLTMLTDSEIYDIYIQADCGAGSTSSFVPSTWLQMLPPTNDTPAGAIMMTLDEGTACGANSITGISNAQTSDSGLATPACGNYNAVNGNGDLWYTVVAPASGQITFNTENLIGLTSVAGSFYSGAVGSLTEIDCTEFGSGWPWTLSSLAPGTTYYLRVWDFGNDQIGTFDLCGYFQSCLDISNVSNSVTSATEVTISWTAGGSELSWNYEWGITGFTQGSGTTGSTSTATLDLNMLTQDETYDIYIQADCGGGSTGSFVSYTWEQIVPPANDDCDNAIPLTIATDGTCTITSGTTVGATASSQADDITGTPNTDVWFSFVATASDHTVEITNVVNQGGGTSTSTDMGMGVYDATGGCNALTLMDDSDPNTLNLSGLTVGTTYLLRAYGWSSSIQYNTFNICVSGPIPPITPNYSESFDSYPALGWGEATGSYGSPSGTSSTWLGDDFANDLANPNGRAARINVFGTNADEYLISPVFDLSAMDYYLNFDLALTEYAATTAANFGPDDYVALLVTEDGGTNWTELQRWDQTSVISNTGEDNSEIILSGYGATVQFAFYAFSDTSNEDNDFFIDNFQITNATLGLSDLRLSNFKLFPTQVGNTLNFQSKNEVQSLAIFGISGQKILNIQPYKSESQVDVSELESGLYLVQVQIGNESKTYKIIKK